MQMSSAYRNCFVRFNGAEVGHGIQALTHLGWDLTLAATDQTVGYFPR